MPDTLLIGDCAYSSWSLRAWLLFDHFKLPVVTKHVDFMKEAVAAQMVDHTPSCTVPTLVCEDGSLAWDSFSIAEELASRHPEAGLWPDDPALRALARSLAAEMHSGFSALRADCPMNLYTAYSGFEPSEAVRADLARIDTLWGHALSVSGGPWLAGKYSVADAFFAPVAARIAGYDLPVGETAQAYVARHLAEPSFLRWRAMGLEHGQILPWYAKDLETRPWPGPA